MIRVTLSVVLAAALIGASGSAIDDGRREHTDALVQDRIETLERTARALLDSDDAVSGRGARRVVAFDLPVRTWSNAGIRAVTIADLDAARGVGVTWTLADSPAHSKRTTGLPLRTARGRPIEFRTGGRYRLVLALEGTPSDPVVTIRRFKSRDGVSVTHA